MSKIVITPVGTSLLMNYKDKNKNMIDDELRNLQDHEKRDKPAEEWGNCSSAIKKIKDKVAPWAKNKLNAGDVTASAEITSLVKILEEVNDDLEVYLLATDTVISRVAAEILQMVFLDFAKNGHRIKIAFNPTSINIHEQDVIKGLQVMDDFQFQQTGLSNFFKRIKSITKDFEDGAILNITGGFKATIPYSTIIGQLYNIPECYIFEETDKLLHIPKLPVQFDWGIAEQYYPYLGHPLDVVNAGKDIQDALLENHLVYRHADGKFEFTIIADMFSAFVEKSLPLAKNVIGFFVEYKLFEFYTMNSYTSQQGKAFSMAIRGKKWQTLDNLEIDIVLQQTGNLQDCPTSPFIFIEVKPFISFFCKSDDPFSKIKKQIQRQILRLVKHKNIPEEYHLCIYLYRNLRNQKHKIVDRLKELKSLFADMPTCMFKVFFLEIDFHRQEKYYHNPYQRFMSQSILKNSFNEFPLT